VLEVVVVVAITNLLELVDLGVLEVAVLVVQEWVQLEQVQ
jgi:hypothetical protein